MSSTPSVTLIDIGPRQSRVVIGHGSASEVAVQCALGASTIADLFFNSDPPTGGALERAIDAVEDAIMPLRAVVPADSELVACGDALCEWMCAASNSDTCGPVPVAAVEEVFQRIASASLGDPMARQGLPGGTAIVATTLILREFMHHLGFAAIKPGP